MQYTFLFLETIIISSENLYGNIPLFKNDDSEIMATQYNMKDCEKAGLLKFDFLGLANLTIIDQTLKLNKFYWLLLLFHIYYQ